MESVEYIPLVNHMLEVLEKQRVSTNKDHFILGELTNRQLDDVARFVTSFAESVLPEKEGE